MRNLSVQLSGPMAWPWGMQWGTSNGIAQRFRWPSDRMVVLWRLALQTWRMTRKLSVRLCRLARLSVSLPLSLGSFSPYLACKDKREREREREKGEKERGERGRDIGMYILHVYIDWSACTLHIHKGRQGLLWSKSWGLGSYHLLQVCNNSSTMRL